MIGIAALGGEYVFERYFARAGIIFVGWCEFSEEIVHFLNPKRIVGHRVGAPARAVRQAPLGHGKWFAFGLGELLD